MGFFKEMFRQVSSLSVYNVLFAFVANMNDQDVLYILNTYVMEHLSKDKSLHTSVQSQLNIICLWTMFAYIIAYYGITGICVL